MVVRSSEADGLDALRRRLYARDVTAEDIEAYRAAEQEAAALLPAPSPEPGAAPPRTRTRRTVAVAASVLLAAGLTAAVVSRPSAVRTVVAETPTPVPSSAALLEERLATSASASAAFVRALDADDAPGLLDYFYRHPAFLPDALKTDTRADSQEYFGTGPSTIALDPSVLAGSGGRVTVIMVLESAGSYSWQAERIAPGNDRSGPVITLGAQAGGAEPGEPTSTTFGYDRDPPSRVSLEVGASMHWGAVVVFTD